MLLWYFTIIACIKMCFIDLKDNLELFNLKDQITTTVMINIVSFLKNFNVYFKAQLNLKLRGPCQFDFFCKKK